MAFEDFARMADDGCPNCGDDWPQNIRVLIVRDDPDAFPRMVRNIEAEMARRKLAGEPPLIFSVRD